MSYRRHEEKESYRSIFCQYLLLSVLIRIGIETKWKRKWRFFFTFLYCKDGWWCSYRCCPSFWKVCYRGTISKYVCAGIEVVASLFNYRWTTFNYSLFTFSQSLLKEDFMIGNFNFVFGRQAAGSFGLNNGYPDPLWSSCKEVLGRGGERRRAKIEWLWVRHLVVILTQTKQWNCFTSWSI